MATGLIELSDEEYACAMAMASKNYSCHKLPFLVGDWVETIFLGIDDGGKDPPGVH